jgi:hypothetical protein
MIENGIKLTTTTAWPCQIPGDLDCDCDADVLDIMLVASHWRTAEGGENYDPFYDLDDDGDIDILDIMLVAVHWGEACGRGGSLDHDTRERPRKARDAFATFASFTLPC